MKRPIEDGLSLLIGAGIGAAVMYMLDPEAGERRRTTVQRSTRSAMSTASDSASAAFGNAKEAADGLKHKAQHLVGLMNDAVAQGTAAGVDAVTSRATSVAKDLYNQLSMKAAGVADSASELRDRAGDQVSSAARAARGRYGSWLNRTSLALGRDEDHHYLGQTSCALGSLALGAGLAYFLDFKQGRQRRERAVNLTTHAVGEVGEFFHRAGSHLTNPGKKVAAAARTVKGRITRLHADFNGKSTRSPSEPVPADLTST